jgi:hypothetical protein
MAKKRRKPRRNPAMLMEEIKERTGVDPHEINELAQEAIEEMMPELIDIFEDILDDASITLGYNIREHPGVEKTLLHLIRTEL